MSQPPFRNSLDPFRELLRDERKSQSPPQAQKKRPVRRKLPQPQSTTANSPEASGPAVSSQTQTAPIRRNTQLGGQLPQQHSTIPKPAKTNPPTSSQNPPAPKRRKAESESQDQTARKRQKTQEERQLLQPKPLTRNPPEESNEAPSILQSAPPWKRRKTQLGGSLPNPELAVPKHRESTVPTLLHKTLSPSEQRAILQGVNHPPASSSSSNSDSDSTSGPQPPSPFILNQRVYLNLASLTREYPFYPTRRNPVPLHMSLSESFTISAKHADDTSFGAVWRYRLSGQRPWKWFEERELVDEEGRDYLDLRKMVGGRKMGVGRYKPQGPIPGEELAKNPEFQLGTVKLEDGPVFDNEEGLFVSEEEEENQDPWERERANDLRARQNDDWIEDTEIPTPQQNVTAKKERKSSKAKKQKPRVRSPSINDLLNIAGGAGGSNS